MTGTLELLAVDPELRAALAGPSPGPGGATGDASPRAPDAATIAKAMHDQLTSKNGMQPDLFAVFTPANQLVWAPPGSPLDRGRPRASSRRSRRSRGGSVVRAPDPAASAACPYQVSALPIRAPDSDQIVGGILAGVKLQRYFDEWAESDRRQPRRRGCARR